MAFVLFGAMVVLQSSTTLDLPKVAYLVGTVLCLIAAAFAVWQHRRTTQVVLQARWIWVSAAMAVLIALSFIVARANGTSTLDWLRDVAAYALFAAVPIFALDGQASASRNLIVGMLVLAGLLGGFSWAVEWLSRRHILDLPIGRLVFPSGQLPGMLYMFAMATALTASRPRVAWILVAGVVLGLFLLTGTRSSLLLLVGPLAIAALVGRSRAWPSVRTFGGHGIVALAVVLMFQFGLALPAVLEPEPTTGEPGGSSSPVPSVPSVLDERFASLPALLGNLASDPSFRERAAQYQAAWALSISSPIVGVGPGHAIHWVDVSGYQRTGFTADTPLVMPAKYGLLGILVFLGAALAYGSSIRIALHRWPRSAITLTLVGYGVWTLVGLPLGFPIEDKGASLALMLLLALAFAESAAPASSLNPGAGTTADQTVR